MADQATNNAASTAQMERVVLLPYQRRWVEDRSPLKIWLASRQVGKSFAVAMEAVDLATRGRCNNLILSSSERQSQEVMRKVFMHLGYCEARSAGAWAAERETREEVELPNGSRIISLPANPDTVRGFTGNVFLDEFAFHSDSESIWRAMYPAVTRGFGIRITSTPNGKLGMFYRLWAGDSRFSRHKVSIHDAVREGLEANVELLSAGITDPEAWAQEYECEFLDEATAYITLEMIAACEHPGATRETFVDDVIPASPGEAGARRESVLTPSFPLTLRGMKGGYSGQAGMTNREIYLGIDVGRRHDLTVFWLLEKVGDVLWIRMLREMRGVPFSLQRDYLYSLMDGSAVRRACVDASGIGAQLAEEAAERFGARVEPVTFTASVKEDLAVTVRRHFEDRTVRIPADKNLREDLHSVERAYTASGNVRFEAARGGGSHADRFWALALALQAANVPQRVVRYETVGHRERTGGRGCW